MRLHVPHHTSSLSLKENSIKRKPTTGSVLVMNRLDHKVVRKPATMKDRQVVRQLMKKLGEEALFSLIQEENGSRLQIFSNPSPESLCSEASGVVDYASVASSSQDSKLGISRKIKEEQRSGQYVFKAPMHPSSACTSTEPTTAANRPDGRFRCVLCDEAKTAIICTRKNDLKRHIDDFHHSNSQYICPVPGCGQAFDWEKAFRLHLKETHKDRSVKNNKHESQRILLCEQVVYACGFKDCYRRFEAHNDQAGLKMFKEYVNHVVKHFDDGSSPDDWSYSHRLRNLLGQPSMQGAWARLESDNRYQTLEWDYQSTSALRKLLETRHIVNADALVSHALGLGSCYGPPEWRRQTELAPPILRACELAVPGHNPHLGPRQYPMECATTRKQRRQQGDMVVVVAAEEEAESESYAYEFDCIMQSFAAPAGMAVDATGPGPSDVVMESTKDGFSPAMTYYSSVQNTPTTPATTDVMPRLLHTVDSPREYSLTAGFDVTGGQSVDPQLYQRIHGHAMAAGGEGELTSHMFSNNIAHHYDEGFTVLEGMFQQ